MEKKDVKEWVRSGIEAEASALEQQVNDNQELNGIEMPEDSFADLMARIEASEKNGAAKSPKPFRIRKRTLLAVALVAILIAALGAGATGAKLFVPKVENRGKDGEMRVSINSDEEDIELREITEEEAYEEIEEKLGILALRLGYKPNGMELEKVFIDEKMGEASMEFYYGQHVLTVYENKPNKNGSFNTKPDGEIVDTVGLFYLGQTIDIMAVDKGDGEAFYRVQLEQGNAYYYIVCDMELEEFENILTGIIFNTI